MNRRERLMATLEGRPVDRPPVNFYEINGLDEDPADADPFNIYSDPSWKPLLDLAREKTDRIVMRPVRFRNPRPEPAGRGRPRPGRNTRTAAASRSGRCARAGAR